MNASRSAVVLASAGALSAIGPVSALAAPAASVSCGTELTVSTTLTRDLLGCAGDGLVVGADGITVNLNGHLIAGNPNGSPSGIGVRVTGHHNVTVTNGTVQGFWRGVVFDDSPTGVVTSMTAQRMTNRGVVFEGGSDHGRIVSNVSADNQASGIAIVTSDGVVVSDNQSLRNVGGAGVRLEGATHVTVSRNALNSNENGVQMVQDGAGISAVANMVVDNTLTDDASAGFEILFSNLNVIARNQVSGATGGIVLESSDDNTITDNRVLHGVAPDGIGIQIYGNRNLVAHNTVIDQLRYGIEVDDFGDPGHSPAVDNILQDNTVNRAVLGIAIGPEAGGVVLRTVISHNRVTNAGDDGIQLIGPSTGLQTSTLARNVAVHNGNWGIETIPGTIDGGGNIAAANGNPGQCLNITCR
jgi:parallel beta-helix repeat protein